MMEHWLDGIALEDPSKGWSVSGETTNVTGIPSASATMLKVPGRPGAIMTSADHGTSVYRLAMIVEATDLQQLRTRTDELKGLIGYRGQAKTLSRLSTEGKRVAPVKLITDVTPKTHSTNAIITADFLIEGVFWRSENPITVTAGSGVITSLAGVNAPIFDPTITITGAGSSTNVTVRDVDSGSYLTLAGNISSGAQVVIDPVALTAKAGATNYASALDFGPLPFRISPSANITVTGAATVQLTAKKAWW